MSRDWLQDALKACGLPSSPTLEDLTHVSSIHPISLEPRPKLTSRMVREWLTAEGFSPDIVPDPNRRLHGCLVAKGGYGVLFYDSSDSERQQRFTLAHEVAHFVLDYNLMHRRAIRTFGEDIRPVLKGGRPPSRQEVLSSIFERAPLGAPARLMERNPSGAPSTDTALETELRADLLTFELLAPEKTALAVIKEQGRVQAGTALAYRFDLPDKEARAYAHELRARRATPRPFFLDL